MQLFRKAGQNFKQHPRLYKFHSHSNQDTRERILLKNAQWAAVKKIRRVVKRYLPFIYQPFSNLPNICGC